MTEHPFNPIEVHIHRGRFLDAAGRCTGPERFFVSYVEADGCECTMGDVADYSTAFIDAMELAAEAGGLPIIDRADEGTVR